MWNADISSVDEIIEEFNRIKILYHVKYLK